MNLYKCRVATLQSLYSSSCCDNFWLFKYFKRIAIWSRVTFYLVNLSKLFLNITPTLCKKLCEFTSLIEGHHSFSMNRFSMN